MHRLADPLAPLGVAVGLLAAAAAAPFTLILAAVGQGFGALLGGCAWIGFSTPPHLAVWALVNEPVLDFAARPAAFGYWWGSFLLPLAVAVGTLPLVPRRRSVGAELVALHTAWMAAVVGIAWLPLADLRDGHLVRWLELHKLPAHLLWLAPVLATVVAVPPVLRLLAIARAARRDLGRARRLLLVVLHLVLPVTGWLALVVLLRGGLSLVALAALVGPPLVALAVAWYGVPRAYAYHLEELTGGSVVRAGLAALLLWAVVATAGRPLTDGRVTGVLWGAPGARNNVRPWIKATSPAEWFHRGG